MIVIVRHHPNAVAAAMDAIEMVAPMAIRAHRPTMLSKLHILDQSAIGGVCRQALTPCVDDQQPVARPLDLMRQKQPPGGAGEHSINGVARHVAPVGGLQIGVRQEILVVDAGVADEYRLAPPSQTVVLTITGPKLL